MYLPHRFFLLLAVTVLVVAAGWVWLPLFNVGRGLLVLLLLVLAFDCWRLWRVDAVSARRECADRFSNGDENRVGIIVESTYPMSVNLEVVDEAPVEFQMRNLCFYVTSQAPSVSYSLTPTTRGAYSFGFIRVFAATRLGLVQRRYTCGEPRTVKVYPSFLRLRQYELMAISNNLREMGVKRIRRIGHNTDFEQIKDYVVGDDYRTINWKATARRHQLMVNQYQEERSQQVFCIIDKGRMMQQAFQGMTLLDYAVNAALVLSHVAIAKEDKAGLCTFAQQFGSFVPASRQPGHMQTIMETLYNEQTTFGESDYSALLAHLNRYVHKRSLLILFTSFTGLSSLNRQLSYLRQLARRHRLLVVFFEDEELNRFMRTPAATTEDYYQHVIAEKFAYEQRLIVQTLRQYGIQSLLTLPRLLTVNVVNRYLDLKSRL